MSLRWKFLGIVAKRTRRGPAQECPFNRKMNNTREPLATGPLKTLITVYRSLLTPRGRSLSGLFPDYFRTISGLCLVSVWSLSGLCLVSVWSLSGLCLVSVWSLSGLCLVSVWSLSGLCLVSVWSLSGLCLVSVWSLSGLCLVSVLPVAGDSPQVPLAFGAIMSVPPLRVRVGEPAKEFLLIFQYPNPLTFRLW